MAVEYLHLHMRRTHWETKYHDNLGTHIQEALDRLASEGWEVVCSVGEHQELILRREKGESK